MYNKTYMQVKRTHTRASRKRFVLHTAIAVGFMLALSAGRVEAAQPIYEDVVYCDVMTKEVEQRINYVFEEDMRRGGKLGVKQIKKLNYINDNACDFGYKGKVNKLLKRAKLNKGQKQALKWVKKAAKTRKEYVHDTVLLEVDRMLEHDKSTDCGYWVDTQGYGHGCMSDVQLDALENIKQLLKD